MSVVDLNRYARNYPLVRLQPRYATTGGNTGVDCCDQVADLQDNVNNLNTRLGRLEDGFHYGLFKQSNDDVIYPELINHAVNTGPFFVELNTIPSEQLMPYNIDINFNEAHLFFNNSRKDVVFKSGKFLYPDRHWDINYDTFDIVFKGIFPDDVY
jgi:hypothetical protein